MRIKLMKENKEYRLKRLSRHNWDTMEIKDNWLILRKEDGSCTNYRLTKNHQKIKSKFNNDFVKKLIEQADEKNE